MMLVALVVVVGVAQMVEVEGSTITLLGAIYGAEGMFCDSFYAVEKECQGAVSCKIPVGNASVCLHYGTPNPKPINVMHVNWMCGSQFLSANLDQGLGDELVIRCPQDERVEVVKKKPVFAKSPVVFEEEKEKTTAGSIFVLGVVIGSENIFCDAYFKSAPICQGKTECTLPIDASLCSIGHPNPDETYNYMHIMFSCGSNFGRLSVKPPSLVPTYRSSVVHCD